MPGYVGVAPGTTTILIRPDGSLGSSWVQDWPSDWNKEPPCGPPNVWPYITTPAFLKSPPFAPAAPTALPSDMWFNPYGSEAALRGVTDIPAVRWVLIFGLGAILAGTAYSYLSRKTRKW